MIWSLRLKSTSAPCAATCTTCSMHSRGSASPGTVAARSTAGLGSVIGYLSLGTRFGNVIAGEQELAEWRGGDGQVRRARIPLVWFTQERRHELA